MDRYSVALVTVVSLVFLPIAAVAETVQESIAAYKKGSADGELFAYINAARGDGFSWANVDLRSRGLPPLYCQPENLSVTVDQYMDILMREVSPNLGKAKSNSNLAGLYLLDGLRKTFPCK